MKSSVKRYSFYKAKPEIFKRARALRKNPTKAEELLWQRLNKSQLEGFRFKPQHPIGKFIVDFYYHKAMLIVEIDGDVHLDEEVAERDEGREYELRKFGLKVLRFKNEEVLSNIDKVVDEISTALNKNATPLNLP
jgi:very-short-patch-repair endonuclease